MLTFENVFFLEYVVRLEHIDDFVLVDDLGAFCEEACGLDLVEHFQD